MRIFLVARLWRLSRFAFRRSGGTWGDLPQAHVGFQRGDLWNDLPFDSSETVPPLIILKTISPLILPYFTMP